MGLFPESAPDMLAWEKRAWQRGSRSVAGIDEAGRGPLAGPVVAAAVILPPDVELPGVTDSKQLTARRREELFLLIQERAMAIGVAAADHGEIDRLNILQATRQAMAAAVTALSVPPDFLLVDGISTVPLAIPQLTVKQGDALSLSIAAASIIAKVTRDRQMEEYDRLYPGYGFARHKGYGSAAHLQAIATLGPAPIHRTTFRGVREHLREGR